MRHNFNRLTQFASDVQNREDIRPYTKAWIQIIGTTIMSAHERKLLDRGFLSSAIIDCELFINVMNPQLRRDIAAIKETKRMIEGMIDIADLTLVNNKYSPSFN